MASPRAVASGSGAPRLRQRPMALICAALGALRCF
jgi:hypothetical protein